MDTNSLRWCRHVGGGLEVPKTWGRSEWAPPTRSDRPEAPLFCGLDDVGSPVRVPEAPRHFSLQASPSASLALAHWCLKEEILRFAMKRAGLPLSENTSFEPCASPVWHCGRRWGGSSVQTSIRKESAGPFTPCHTWVSDAVRPIPKQKGTK